MEADFSDLSDSWRDTYSANFQIKQINPLPFFYRVHVCLTRRHKEKISVSSRLMSSARLWNLKSLLLYSPIATP